MILDGFEKEASHTLPVQFNHTARWHWLCKKLATFLCPNLVQSRSRLVCDSKRKVSCSVKSRPPHDRNHQLLSFKQSGRVAWHQWPGAQTCTNILPLNKGHGLTVCHKRFGREAEMGGKREVALSTSSGQDPGFDRVATDSSSLYRGVRV